MRVLSVSRWFLGIVLPLAAWFFWLRPVALGGPASYIVVSGVSMEPTLRTGDLVVTQRQNLYGTGDVVAFPVTGGVVIHRIVGGTAEGGYVTRGDNRSSDDLWRPTADQILGRMWIRLPRVGTWVETLRKPVALALVTAVLSLAALSGSFAVRRRRKRMRVVPSSSNLMAWPGAVLSMALLALIFLAAGVAMAAQAFSRPAEVVESLERLRYEHMVRFGYTLRVEPSLLYPEGVTGPEAPDRAGAPKQPSPQGREGQPAFPQGAAVYTKSPRDMLISFDYRLNSAEEAELLGMFSADLKVQAGDGGWWRNIVLVPLTEFRGWAFSVVIPVDLGQVVDMISAVERETDFKPAFYQLEVLPKVDIRGRIGRYTVNDIYVPPFRMRWERNRLIPDGELERNEPRVVYDQRTVPAYVPLGPATVPVIAERAIGVGLVLLGMLGVSGAVAVAWRRVAQDEGLRIRTRYGRMIVEVRRADLAKNGQRVEVKSIADLARIAKMEGRQILHAKTDAHEEVYFLQDGAYTYEYRPANGAGATSAQREA